jgi:Preprotein translocase subunit SecD
LQGGSYLLLEIDSKPLVEQKLQSKSLELRRELREKNITYTTFRSEKDSLLFNFKVEQKNNLEQLLNDETINPIISSAAREFSAIYQNDTVTISFTADLLSLIKKML